MNKQTIDDFQQVAKYFGVIYRQYFNQKGTPKLHLLEDHVVEDLRRHKRTGLFDESQVEREHHTNKVYNILFRGVKNWFAKQGAISEKAHFGQVSSVQAASMEMYSSTKRQLSLKTVG